MERVVEGGGSGRGGGREGKYDRYGRTLNIL